MRLREFQNIYFNYLIYFHFVCYVPLTRREREKMGSNRIKMSQMPMLYLLPLF
jgi:hypothetical protein